MNTIDWDRDEILRELARPEGWDELDAKGLDRLAFAALFLAGRADAAVEPLLAGFYPAYARRGATDDRRRVFHRIAAAARSGLLAGAVHADFLRGETDGEIVREAAFELACLDAAGPEGTRGADFVLELVVSGAVLNAGAALGGLLAQADNEMLGKLALLRPALTLPGTGGTLAQMTRAARACVHGGAIEFWLEWIEQLAAGLPGSQRVLDRAADALVRLRESMAEQVVYDDRCTLPAQRAGLRHEHGVHSRPLREYAAAIAPRLAAIAACAPGSGSVARALAAWGLQH